MEEKDQFILHNPYHGYWLLWISNYIRYDVFGMYDGITYPFLHFNGCAVQV